MRVVVVGAGAVGQTYGWMLARAGCEVSFLVRPKYAEELRRGVWVYPEAKGPERWEGFGVITEPIDCDQVWFTVPSPALPSCPLDWPGAMAVLLSGGLHDEEVLRGHFALADIVRGVIPFIAFHAPLPGEQREHEGILWWFPPLMRLPFSGPRANEVTRLLPKAHMTARAESGGGRASASILPAVAALELGGWSMKAMDKDLAARGIREATDVMSAVHELGDLMTPPPMALGLFAGISPLLVPFDLEIYLRYHFTKVGEQTRVALQDWIREGDKRGIAVDTLRTLSAGLPG